MTKDGIDVPSNERHALRAMIAQVQALVTQWREMVTIANTDGPQPNDEAGHYSRWTAVEMCADAISPPSSPERVKWPKGYGPH